MQNCIKKCQTNEEKLGLTYVSAAQGVYARHLLGNASAPNAADFGQCVEPLAKIALQIAKRLVHMCRAECQLPESPREKKSTDADQNRDKNICKRKQACREAGLIRGSC